MAFTKARSPKLLEKKFNQLYIPHVCAHCAKALILCIDSIVAARYVGASALAAIAICAPFLAIDEVLHDLLGVGISANVAQMVGKGNRKGADRMMGAVITAVLVAYCLFLTPVLVWMEELLGFVSSDPVLVTQAKEYLIPTIIAMPFFEAFMCLERAYQIDGRAILFSSRAIISTACNIVLDIMFVSMLGYGMTGLAVASILATAIGYAVTLSHGFSDKCSIHPDFSVLRDLREMFGYLKSNAFLGGTAALEDGLLAVVNLAMCRILAFCGGAMALILWKLLQIFFDFADAIIRGISVAATPLCGILFGEEDYDGVRIIAKGALVRSFIFGCILTVVVACGTEYIAWIYGIDGVLLSSGMWILRVISPICIFYMLARYYGKYLVSISRIKESYVFIICEKILLLILTIVGAMIGTVQAFSGMVFTYLVLTIVALVTLVRGNTWLLPQNKQGSYFSFSAELIVEEIVRVSREIQKLFTDNGFDEAFAKKLSLLIEESGNYIRIKNEGDIVQEDVRIGINDDRVIVSILDNGKPYNVSSDMASSGIADDIERKIIEGLSESVSYDRVLELNIIVMKTGPRQIGNKKYCWISWGILLETNS